MSDTVIRVENLSKKYVIGLQQQKSGGYNTMRDLIVHRAEQVGQRLRHPFRASNGSGATKEEFWALQDVSFKVKRGERLGIIGRNGAGKSTLLKILSRITEPTGGRITIKGRVSSLLEVGTGFHPELTGRENVYLNGAILGMTRQEINIKFDEIVEFSGVEKFIDTPVKRYSSGMKVRLAFSVAAYLEPEILLVDEVLAVGDANFQKKCLGKMEDISATGRTVLFVSHNMGAIRTLTNRTILLEEGDLVADGPTTETLTTYNQLLREFDLDSETSVDNAKNRRGSGAVRINGIIIIDKSGNQQSQFELGEDVCFKISYVVMEPVEKLLVSMGIRSSKTGEFVAFTDKHVISSNTLSKGHSGHVVLEIPNPLLRIGEYPLYFWLGKDYETPYDVVDDLTIPLIIHTDKTIELLGYDPGKSEGYFDIASTVSVLSD